MAAPRPTTSGERPESGRRLSSWKQIAHYLGRDRRTVMRWEKGLGLPIHRVPGSSRGSAVYAFTCELDAWLAAGHAPTAPPVGEEGGAGARRRWMPLVLGLGVTFAVVLAVFLPRTPVRASRATPLRRLETSQDVVSAYRLDETQAWTYRHPLGRYFKPTGQESTIVDVDGDGATDVLLAANTSDPWDETRWRGELLAFSEAGVPKWRAVQHDTLVFGGRVFSGPWISAAVEVLQVHGEPTVVWALHDHTWWPSILVTLRRDGSVGGRFVNAGWILTAGALPDGHLLAGGINNERRGAMLAVLDATDLDAVSPVTQDGSFACDNCSAGRPKRYFVFPPTDVNGASGLPYNETVSIESTVSGFKAVVREGPVGSDVHWVYEFSRDLELVRAVPSDSYWPKHRLLRLDGYIHHDEAACPERDQRSVLVWTPGEGWGELTVPVG